MNYFQPYLPLLDETIVAAWDSQVAQATETPRLAQALAQSADLFPRFAACYAQLRGLPRATTVLPAATTHTLTKIYDNTYGPTGLPLITSEITISGNGSKIVRSIKKHTPRFRMAAVNSAENLTLTS